MGAKVALAEGYAQGGVCGEIKFGIAFAPVSEGGLVAVVMGV